MKKERSGTTVKLIAALVILVVCFFIFAFTFELIPNPLNKSKMEIGTKEFLLQKALKENIKSDSGKVIIDTTPDPEPVEVSKRSYPALKIVNLDNLEPLSIKDAQEILIQERIRKKQEEEILKSLDLEVLLPDGQYILTSLKDFGRVNAKSFLVGDLDTGEIIFKRKTSISYAIASITKYFTAFTAIKTLEPNEIATIERDELTVQGNRARFRPDDSLTILELLYPLLLVSSNDAAEVIAQQRDRDSFIRDMNKIAEDHNLNNTSFADPSGLSKMNVSNAEDLFAFMKIIRDKYHQVIRISGLSKKTIGPYTWSNINRASTFEEFKGGKTGFTNAALQTSIGYYRIQLSNKQYKNIGVVILQSNTRQQDTRNILDYLKTYVEYQYYDEEEEASESV